jgi:two-component system OmpR family response regulator
MFARITALFRRIEALSQPVETSQVIERGLLSVNLDTMVVAWGGTAIDLTVTELWIVNALSNHPGHVKSRQQLMDAANVVLDDNTITSHVKRIRKKFKAVDGTFDCVQTAYGMGYRWVI